MKILITGSRTINNLYTALENEIGQEDTVIHGGAIGVDSKADEWCKDKGIKTVVVEPLHKDKKHFYLLRNAEMVGMCDKVVAIWDGESKGTKFTIDYAKKRGKEVVVYDFKNKNKEVYQKTC